MKDLIYIASKRNKEPKPPLATVGSQINQEEQMFGAAFDGHIIKRFFLFLKPYKNKLWLSLGAVLIFTFSQMAIPLIIRYVIDDSLLSESGTINFLFTASILFGIVIVINYLANLVQELIVARVAEKVLFDLRRAMFYHLQKVALSFMDHTEVGRLMSRLQGDVGALQEFLESSVAAIGDLVLLVGIMIILVILNPLLGIVTMAIIPALFIIRAFWLPHARKAFLKARETSSSANGALAESINGVRLIQEMNREHTNWDLYEEKVYSNLLSHIRATRFTQIMIPTVDTLSGIALSVVIVLGGALVINLKIELGILIAFFFYVQRFFAPIRSVTMQYSVMQRAMASGQRIFEVLDVPVQIKDSANAQDPSAINGTIKFQNVTFGYVKNQPILHDISFEATEGETIALVGPTGSGKTSMTALAHRFYDVWSGRVLIGDYDVKNMTQASLGRHIGMVLQEPFLFTGSVAENIKYANSKATLATIKEAASLVGAHEFVVKLPQGYDTNLEQRGTNLSLGQRQLISFARAIVADTKILILDEATANIDSYTEMQIQEGLKGLLSNRTGLIIAHRLATVRNADKILVLSEGRIIEQGTHDSLIENNGLYEKLYSMHYASFDDIPSSQPYSEESEETRT